MKIIPYLTIIFAFAITISKCTSTEEKNIAESNQIHADKNYIHPKSMGKTLKQQFQIFRIHDEESFYAITKDKNNQIQFTEKSELSPNIREFVYFLITESENPDKPDLFEIETILLNGEKGKLSFLADYDHLLIKTVVNNSRNSGKRERNHHINVKMVPIKRNESTENLYNVPRKFSNQVNLIRSKKYIYQFPKKLLTSSENKLIILIDDIRHSFSFDHFEEI